MEPNDIGYRKARWVRSRLKGSTCKNQNFTEMTLRGYNGETKQNEYEGENTGCKNRRRVGSAYCEECAEKFKQQNGS